MIIIYILIALAAAAVIAFVAGSLRNRSLKKKLAQGEISEMPTVVQPPQECCDLRLREGYRSMRKRKPVGCRKQTNRVLQR